MSDLIERQAVLSLVSDGREGLENIIYAFDVEQLPSVSAEKSLDKAKSEIRCGENKAYNADFTMGCEYAISVIERMFEEVEE